MLFYKSCPVRYVFHQKNLSRNHYSSGSILPRLSEARLKESSKKNSFEKVVKGPRFTPNQQVVNVLLEDSATIADFARDVVRRKEAQQLDDWDEPFYVGDLGAVFNKFRLWKRELPTVKPYYAVKANSLQPVVRLLAALGLGFDCASKMEIRQVIENGVDLVDIIYANPNKSLTHLHYAKNEGVEKMCFDSESELYKIKEIFPAAKLLLRLKTDGSYSKAPFGNKFGASFEESRYLLLKAKQYRLNVIGICFHIGTAATSSKPFVRAFNDSRQLFDAGRSLGHDMAILDIGGGFPADNHELFLQMAATIRSCAARLFSPADGVAMIAEPGRFFVDTAFSLLTNVIGKRTTREGFSYCVNDGVYASFSKIIFESASYHPSPLFLERKAREMKQHRLIVYGPTCCGYDVITDQSSTLAEMFIGDWLIWNDLGSYTVLMTVGFNGFFTNKAQFFITKEKLREVTMATLHANLLPEFTEDS